MYEDSVREEYSRVTPSPFSRRFFRNQVQRYKKNPKYANLFYKLQDFVGDNPFVAYSYNLISIPIRWFVKATHSRASLTRTGHRRQGKQQWDAHQGWGLWYNGATRPYPMLRIDWDHAICFHRIQLVGTVSVLRYRHSLLRRGRLWVSAQVQTSHRVNNLRNNATMC